MVTIELDDKVAEDLFNYLVKAKRRNEFVINKKYKYSSAAIKRAEKNINLLTPIINALQSKLQVKIAETETVQKGYDVDSRLTALEVSVQSINAMLQDLKDKIKTICEERGIE